jgi:hypothetical protein
MEVPNSMNPVVYSPVKTREITSDPFVREAYFGSPDTPGIINAAYDAANRVYGSPAVLVSSHIATSNNASLRAM